MKKARKDIIESSIGMTAAFLGAKVTREEAWTWNVFRKKFRYVDNSGRRYKAVSRNGCQAVVTVTPSPRDKERLPGSRAVEFIATRDSLFRKTDMRLVLDFIGYFFKSRDYNINFLQPKEKMSPGKRPKSVFIEDCGHYGEIKFLRTFPTWEITVKDAEESGPYFCTQGFSYRFKLKPSVEAEEAGNVSGILMEYEENETEDAPLLSSSWIRKTIYGFQSPNLRAFYSDQGLFPEVQHAIKQTVCANLAVGIINASVFVRVAERLKGNTWYTLAAGLLVFIRAPAEVFYVRRSLGISKHFPSAIVRNTMESQSFRKFMERKDVRIWRNFEKKLYDIVRKKENFTILLERYDGLKKDINNALGDDRERVLGILGEELNFNGEELAEIRYFLFQMEPLDVESIKRELWESIEILMKKKILKPNAELSLRKYVDEIFPINLLNSTFSKTLKILRDRIKQEERVPSKEDVSKLVTTCKKQILPFRFIDIMLFFSLYSMGYAATFIKNLPDTMIPLYYIFYGAATNVINAAVLRIGAQVSMQYIYANLGNAPTISSAADAWNEYNSHLMRLWAIFSSLGLMIGMGGKLISNATHDISRYAVEIFALILYVKSFREWYFYYTALETKIKTEEPK